jgi:8-oxo-dGTP pyrophosphatase MutT (NUDIX family)
LSIRGFAPTAYKAYPRALSRLGFVAGSETVTASAAPILCRHRHSAPAPSLHDGAPAPAYACALIEDGRGRLLLELRAPDARRAAATLTCFGGGREAGETAEQALHRELAEELAWAPPTCAFSCDLRGADGRWIARFFRCPYDGAAIRCEPGVVPLWAPWPALAGLPVSPWHRAVLAAVAAGRSEAVA